MAQTKTFQYDVLLSKENICNRSSEIRALNSAAYNNKKIVLFAPRRYGKTSLIKNVVAENFKQRIKNDLVLYIDLMDVKSLESIQNRIQTALSFALSSKLNTQDKIKKWLSIFKNIALRLEFDPITGTPSLEFAPKAQESKKSLELLFASLKEMQKSHRIMLVLDEFQDISFIEEAEALWRGLLQELSECSVFILGSKRHLLQKMFDNNNSALFHYGDELHLTPISLQDWLPYFEERLAPKKLKIDEESLRFLLELMYDVPNAICELGAYLVETNLNKTLSKEIIKNNLNQLVQVRQSYAYKRQFLNQNENTLLSALSQTGFVTSPQSADFVAKTGLSKSTLGYTLQNLLDNGLIEYELNRGYRVSDPIFGYYLAQFH